MASHDDSHFDTPQPEKETPKCPARKTHLHTTGSRSQGARRDRLSGTQITNAMGLPTRTVDDVSNGRNGWGEIIANHEAFRKYRTDAKHKMQAASIKLSEKALRQSKTSATRPARHRRRGLRDTAQWERLDAGEPRRTMSYTRQEIEKAWMRWLLRCLRRCSRLRNKLTSLPGPAKQSRSLRSRGTVISGWRDWKVAVLQ